MHFYPHNIADFNNATRHLTRVERSVYRDAIEHYYDTESVLTKDFKTLSKRLLCTSEEEKEALKTVLSEFFIENEDGYFHKRCHDEIQKYRANTSAKAKAGIASAAKRKQKSTDVEHALNECTTDVQLTNNQEPITNNQLNTIVLSQADDNCPHQKIIDLYHEKLPMLTRVKVWNAKRQNQLKARWRENEKRQSLEFWGRLFDYIAESDLLTGRLGDWKADLEWITKSDNFVKIIEGKYVNRTAA